MQITIIKLLCRKISLKFLKQEKSEQKGKIMVFASINKHFQQLKKGIKEKTDIFEKRYWFKIYSRSVNRKNVNEKNLF